MKKVIRIFNTAVTVAVAGGLLWAGFWVSQWLDEARVLRRVVERLGAESRAAEVLVTKSEYDEASKKIRTTIKFLEYDAKGTPLEPRYFDFFGNQIQFQSLVIRFKDDLVKAGNKLRGKSAYLFMKVFVLEGDRPQVFDLTEARAIPKGYKIPGEKSAFEIRLWEEFWDYALDPEARERVGIKNAQIEAPGTMFLPGTIYTIRIEHDGGLRIDAQPIPHVLKGEKL